MKTAILLLAAVQAQTSLTSRDYSSYNEGQLGATHADPKNYDSNKLGDTVNGDGSGSYTGNNLGDPSVDDTTAQRAMLGAWKPQQTPSDADVKMFSGYKDMILKFVNVKSYPKFVPISYASQTVNGTNYKIIYDVSPNEDTTEHVITVINVPLPNSNEVPTILSVTLPNGTRHMSQVTHSVEPSNETCGGPGAVSCW